MSGPRPRAPRCRPRLWGPSSSLPCVKATGYGNNVPSSAFGLLPGAFFDLGFARLSFSFVWEFVDLYAVFLYAPSETQHPAACRLCSCEQRLLPEDDEASLAVLNGPYGAAAHRRPARRSPAASPRPGILGAFAH